MTAVPPTTATTRGGRARRTERGLAYCRRLCDITDEWVIELFDQVMAEHRLDKGRVALLATGGYGRGELAPFSDLDLLLVHDLKAKEVRSKIEPIATALWYPLWDAGVKLGHAVRTLKEQVELAKTDLDSATALLTARPLAGDDELAREVVETGAQAVGAHGAQHIESLRVRVRARESEETEVAYRLDPDLKDGHGGLRDVQSLWWANAAGMHMSAGDEADLRRVLRHPAAGPGRVAPRDRAFRRRAPARGAGRHRGAGRVDRCGQPDGLRGRGGSNRRVARARRTGGGRSPGRSPSIRAVAPGVVLVDGEIELVAGADPAADQTLVLKAAVAAAPPTCASDGRRSTCCIARSRGGRATGRSGATDELVALLLEGHRAIPVLEALDQRELFAVCCPNGSRSDPSRSATRITASPSIGTCGRPRRTPPSSPTESVGPTCS